ncbi:MAG: hypothetical protein WCK51_13830 [Armatimonadota bacterium]
MQTRRFNSSLVFALTILGASAFANPFLQGARPIDGELGINNEGKVTGLLRAESEANTGLRVSIAIAIGSYATEAEEDAAIAQGTNGSRGFKVISLPGTQVITDLSAPWEAGVSLPLCDKATLVVRSVELRTNTVRITRNMMQKGMTTVLQAKVRLPDIMKNDPQPTFASERPVLIPKSRSLPIDGLVGMDAAGRLTGYVAPRGDHFSLAVAFVPGNGLTLDEGLRLLSNSSTPDAIPFTGFEASTNLRDLTPNGSSAGGVIQQLAGLIIVRETEAGSTTANYSFVQVSAGAPTKWVPTRNPQVRASANKAIGISLTDILSRSLPIDGNVTLSPGSGTVEGNIIVGPPVGLRSYSTIDIASVGLNMGNSQDSAEELLKQLKRKDPDLKESFKTIKFGTSYELVRNKPVGNQLQLAKGAKVAMLFRFDGPYGREYSVSVIERNGKPPHGR